MRLHAFGGVALLWFGLIALRLADLQLLRQDELADRAQRQQMAEVDILPRRGGILDRRLEELALSTPAQSIGVFADCVSDKRSMAAMLSEAAGVDARDLQERLGRGGFQWVKRLANLAEYQRVKQLRGRDEYQRAKVQDPSRHCQALHFETESKRYYPHGTVGAHVVGIVGLDHSGQAGLELEYDSRLRGEAGLRVLEYDGRHRRYGAQVIKPSRPGDDIILDLDLRLQSLASLELERAVRESESQAGTVVLMRPGSGEILAMANWPRFDPNRFPRPARYLENLRNFAVCHLVEPGSTFKVLTAAAALEEGLVTPDDVFDCEMGGMWVHRRRIRDHHPYGLLTMPEVLMKSSNVGIIKIGYRVGAETLHGYIRRFGFGQSTGVGLPGEVTGLVRPLDRWSGASLASLSMGQEVGVSAVQMARLFAAVANGGTLVKPRIVRGVREHGGAVESFEPEPGSRVIGAETAATMQAILERVVEDGTGQLARIPGYRVAGKTGTAQMINPVSRSYADGAYLASFCGFAPVNDPVLVGVVMLYDPRGEDYYGGKIAAPLFGAVMKKALRMLDIPPSRAVPREAVPAPGVPDTILADFVGGRVGELAEPGPPSAAAPPTGSPPGPAAREPFGNARAEAAAPRVQLRSAPDLRGLTLREALSVGALLGIQIEPVGSGLAHAQTPEPNAMLAEGQAIRLHLAPSLDDDGVAGRAEPEGGG